MALALVIVVGTGMPAYPIPAKIVAHAAAVVACTHVAAQEDTMVLVVSTGMLAYPIPVKMVGHVSIIVTHTDVAAQVDT